MRNLIVVCIALIISLAAILGIMPKFAGLSLGAGWSTDSTQCATTAINCIPNNACINPSGAQTAGWPLRYKRLQDCSVQTDKVAQGLDVVGYFLVSLIICYVVGRLLWPGKRYSL